MVSIRIFQHVARWQQLYQAMLKEAGPTRTFEDVMKTYFTELRQRFLPKSWLKVGGSLRAKRYFALQKKRDYAGSEVQGDRKDRPKHLLNRDSDYNDEI